MYSLWLGHGAVIKQRALQRCAGTRGLATLIYSTIKAPGQLLLAGLFFGSLRITGKDALDLHEKELAVPVAIRHALDDFNSIVYPFQLPCMHRPPNSAHNPSPIAFQSFCKLNWMRFF